MHTRAFLSYMHRALTPSLYLEIGVRYGHSLALSRCVSYGIDPAFQITEEINATVRLFKKRSDDFFKIPNINSLFEKRIDMAFIDGMHLFENALQDFINCEKWSHPGGVIVLDDMLPTNVIEARRKRETASWTGDVWKLIPLLTAHRPDLIILPVATNGTGVLVVANLDPSNTRLSALTEVDFKNLDLDEDTDPPDYILKRTGALAAEDLSRSSVLQEIGETQAASAKRDLIRSAFPNYFPPGSFGRLQEPSVG